MSGLYAYTPEIWPPLIAAILIAALGVYSWRQRAVPGARVLAFACLFVMLWLLAIVAEAAAMNVSDRVAWRSLQAVMVLPAVTANTCFVLEYAYPGRWLTRRNVILLFIPSLLLVLLVVTSDLHVLLGPGVENVGTFRPTSRGGVWAFTVYAFGLILLSSAVLLQLFLRSPQHRWPAALMLLGEIGGLAIYILGLGFGGQFASIDFLVIGLLFHTFLYAIALFGFRMLDPMTAARRSVIEQMPEGMAVFDAQGRVANLNPAAAGILDTTEAHARGKTLEELLPGYPGLVERLAAAEAAPVEVGLDGGGKARYYALDLSPLEDFRGLLIGRLLILRDVTEQHIAQAIILEEERAQATLQERILLADELHDGLTQQLAFLHLQAEAAQLYLKSERPQDAQLTLARLSEVARGLQTETRELIGDLLAVSLPAEGFLDALGQVVARFETQTGLPVRLRVVGDATTLRDSSLLTTFATIQLVRIVQEALANVRKHAGNPSGVCIELKIGDDELRVTVEDDGIGFDPEAVDGGGRFGLRVMRQRAARIGGQLALHSAPGQGTWIEVLVPFNPAEGHIEEAGD